MTPKEKAISIYDLMKGFRVKNSHRKKCALVCVNEIIDFIPRKDTNTHLWYWQEVKREIETL